MDVEPFPKSPSIESIIEDLSEKEGPGELPKKGSSRVDRSNIGVVKNNKGQIIQKHFVNFKTLKLKRQDTKSTTEKVSSEQSVVERKVVKTKWHRNKRLESLEGTKSLGFEFFSFVGLRNKVNEDKSRIDQTLLFSQNSIR